MAGIFRTLRYGVAEAHGRAEMMEFNYLVEQKAVNRMAGKYAVDFRADAGDARVVIEGAAHD